MTVVAGQIDDEVPFHRPLSDAPAEPAEGPPGRVILQGRWVQVEPLDSASAPELFAASHREPAETERLWQWLFEKPFADVSAMATWLAERARSTDPLFVQLRDRSSGKLLGMASWMNIHPSRGSIELGSIWFGFELQRTPAATEAIFLMAREAMDRLGFRRLEWKCNALNAPSRAAARRFGFRFEGIFHRHMIVKGRNRDTAWYSIVEDEWPAVRSATERWLDPANFDENGKQRARLAELIAAAR